MLTKNKPVYLKTKDHFENDKFIKQWNDGCEVVQYMIPNGPYRHAEYPKPYPADGSEVLVPSTKAEFESNKAKAIQKPKHSKVKP